MSGTNSATAGSGIKTGHIIRTIRQQARDKAAAGSGKSASTGSSARAMTVAQLSAQANRRHVVLQSRMEGVDTQKFSYPESMKRLSDLQETAGIENIVLTGLATAYYSANPLNQIPTDSKEATIVGELRDQAKAEFNHPSSVKNDSLGKLAGNLRMLGHAVSSTKVSKEVDELLLEIGKLRGSVFSEDNMKANVSWENNGTSAENIGPAVLSDIDRHTATQFHVNHIKPTANAYSCAEMDAQKAEALKDGLKNVLQRSWVLSHQVKVMGQTQTNMQAASKKAALLQKTVEQILRRSDALLKQECSLLKQAKAN
ncbi:MAG: hypothetical protein OXU45_02685 [Candidatus Melainabacteria bacterium]|nr:hypothetical protein [Candidatus Melainabacteria bacterium]